MKELEGMDCFLGNKRWNYLVRLWILQRFVVPRRLSQGMRMCRVRLRICEARMIGVFATYLFEFPFLLHAIRSKTGLQKMGAEMGVERTLSKTQVTKGEAGLRVYKPPLHSNNAAARVEDQGMCAVVHHTD
jgi:hypothetical protein